MEQVLFACEAGFVGMYDFADEKELRQIRPMHTADILNDCDLASNNNILATVGDHHLITFDLRTGYCQQRLDYGEFFKSASSVRFGLPQRESLLLVVTNEGPMSL